MELLQAIYFVCKAIKLSQREPQSTFFGVLPWSSLCLGRSRNGSPDTAQLPDCHQLWPLGPYRRPSLYARLAPYAKTRSFCIQGLPPVLTAFLTWRIGVLRTTIVSSVENLWVFAHSNRLLRVLPVDILVSLTIVHVPHSGHFKTSPLGLPWVVQQTYPLVLMLVLCACKQCQNT